MSRFILLFKAAAHRDPIIVHRERIVMDRTVLQPSLSGAVAPKLPLFIINCYPWIEGKCGTTRRGPGGTEETKKNYEPFKIVEMKMRKYN